MNREIKFRAWDGKKMHYNAIVGNGQVLFIPGATGEYKWFNQAEVTPLEYTGLKDKNGKEIYEGDILKESESGIFEVVWCSKYCKFKLDWPRVSPTIQYPEWNRGVQMEIIGSIYENPELLTSNQ